MSDDTREKTREYFGFGIKRMKELKVCGICGTSVNANRRFCTKCKAEMPHKTLFDIYKSNHRVCPKCEAILSECAEYCPQCGERQAKSPNQFQTAIKKIAL